MTSITAKFAVFVILSAGSFVPTTFAKCVVKPSRDPDAAKPCRQIADYTPPNNGHPSGTRGSGSRLHKDPRDSQLKNHPQACDRFDAKNFQQLDRPLNRQENRWFKDFNCPVG